MNNLSKATAVAAADAALLPIPNPAGTPFFIFISTPPFILNFFIILFTTRPAVFLLGSIGMESSEIILIPLCFVLVRVILSKNASNAKPKTSKPGPKLAVDEGALTEISYI